MIDIKNLSPEERKAISALKRLAKKWPPTLWLFSANGVLTVMRKDENGQIATHGDGGTDQSYIVDRVDIDNDGGDW